MTTKTFRESDLNLIKGLNDQQAQAVLNPIDSATKIVAGAGTGKTKIISKRFVKLVKDMQNSDFKEKIDNSVSEILVITYTEKAAAEMKERIYSELKNNNIESLTQDPWISTIHGFCSRILKKHSIEVNLPPDYKLGNEKQLKDIFDGVIKKIKYSEYKTFDNIDSLAELLGVEPDILSIERMKFFSGISNIDVLFEDIFSVIKKIKSSGLSPKGFLEKTLTSTQCFSEALSALSFGFATREDYYSSWQNHLNNYCEDFFEFDGNEKGAFENIAKEKLILNKDGKSKPELWIQASGFPENLPEITALEVNLAKMIALIYAVYQNELLRLALVDFDDLINKTIEIFKQNEIIRVYYKKFFKHIIVDEFQDTNGAQLELLKLLMSEESANITFVGDRKQSIYGFRHAQMENLETLHSYIEEKYGVKYPELKLEINYRSSPHVLCAVNYLTQKYLKLDELLLPDPDPQTPHEKENKFVKITELTGFDNAYDHKIAEAKYIAAEIIRLKNEKNVKYSDIAVLVSTHSGAELIEKQLLKVNIPAVKKRTSGFFNSPHIKNVIAMLRLAKNNRDELALIRILKIKLTDGELYSIKKAIDNLLQENPFLQSQPPKNLNFCDKLALISEKKIFDNLEIKQKQKEYLKNISDTVFFATKTGQNLTLIQLYYKLINSIKPHSSKTEIEQYQTLSDLRIFEKIIVDYEQTQNYSSIKNFLDYIEKMQADTTFELPTLAFKETDAVQILTIHASKGLEFEYIFLASVKASAKKPQSGNITFDLQHGRKPGFGIIINGRNGNATPKSLLYKEIWEKPRAKNENLRLYYVAISRAKKYLNILSFEKYSKNTPAGYSVDNPNIPTEKVNSGDLSRKEVLF